MAATDAHAEGVPDRCSECGVAAAAIVDWAAHTAWHSGGMATGGKAAIMEFLATVDPEAFEQAMAAQSLAMTTGQAALVVLAGLAEQS